MHIDNCHDRDGVRAEAYLVYMGSRKESWRRHYLGWIFMESSRNLLWNIGARNSIYMLLAYMKSLAVSQVGLGLPVSCRKASNNSSLSNKDVYFCLNVPGLAPSSDIQAFSNSLLYYLWEWPLFC